MIHKNQFMFIIILLLITTGCSNTHFIKKGDDFNIWKKSILLTKDQMTRIKVKHTYLKEDSVYTTDYYTNREYQFHINEVDKLIIKSRTKKFLQGALYGLIGGAAIGYMLGDDDANDPLASKGASAFILGVWGVPIGAVVGVFTIKDKIYFFEEMK